MDIRRRRPFRSPVRRGGRRRRNTRLYLVLAGVVAAIAILAAGAVILRPGSSGTATTSAKPVILYINQGNGSVNETNFGSMLSFSMAQGFNTIFFQVYREGVLLFQPPQLTSFVAQAHDQGLKIFFALYFTNSSQLVPSSIFPLGEDGISLDMSTLSLSAETSLFTAVGQGFQTGQVAITTTDFALPLRPDLLVSRDLRGPGPVVHPPGYHRERRGLRHHQPGGLPAAVPVRPPEQWRGHGLRLRRAHEERLLGPRARAAAASVIFLYPEPERGRHNHGASDTA